MNIFLISTDITNLDLNRDIFDENKSINIEKNNYFKVNIKPQNFKKSHEIFDKESVKYLKNISNNNRLNLKKKQNSGILSKNNSAKDVEENINDIFISKNNLNNFLVEKKDNSILIDNLSYDLDNHFKIIALKVLKRCNFNKNKNEIDDKIKRLNSTNLKFIK